MSMKYSSDTIGNPTRDIQACSAVPQPTEPPRYPYIYIYIYIIPTFSSGEPKLRGGGVAQLYKEFSEFRIT